MRSIIIASLPILLLALEGCTPRTLTEEPGDGSLRFGQKVLVDDGSCPAGQIKQITGGNGTTVRRKTECIGRPAS